MINVVLRAKKEREHPDCYQCKVENPGSVMVVFVGHLHVFEGTVNAERYVHILEQRILDDIFFKDIQAYFSNTTRSRILYVLKQRCFVILTVQVLHWPA